MQFNQLKRREFITLLGGAAVVSWPLAADAQQRTTHVVGYLSGGAPGPPFTAFLAAFRQGLSETGYVEGQNVTIEYRWAEGHYDRLPALAADLVERKVDLIAASGGDLAARAAKGASSTIPIVFTSGDDPAETGLVASLARPGGNLTGFSLLVVELHAKRLELISELVPNAKVIALLVNPDSPQTERVVRAMQEAARVKGVKLEVLKAATESEIDTAFASLSQMPAGALVQQADPFFLNRRNQLALLAVRRAVPAIYESRPFVEAGGLMSYGANFPEMYRQIGVYAGRILKGERPADLPVMRPTKLDLVINLAAAKAIGLMIPESLLLRADQVIE
jgi:putative tryptophan/tyrosine transport system substrate-binding protein